ncbi:MAG: protein kinase [Myxococcales bacterium]|nr:protein kinase [Myxococcales bacterium]
MSACPSCGTTAPADARFCQRCGAALPSVEGATDPYIGRVVQNYRIMSVIGAGGMGKVYRAEQVKLKRPVCLKTLLPHLANDPTLVQRFELEGVATAAIRHPNIVQVMDFGQLDDRTLYIAMEYVEGKTLREVLRQESPVTLSRALTIVQQMLSGLAEAHANNIVHRDLKPSNVLMSRLRDGTDLVKLVDFGIAKILGQESEGKQLTRTGMMVGTPGYMAPEQMLGEAVAPTTDLYSVGVIFWELLTGQKLFGRVEEAELARRHLTMPAPSPSSVSRVPLPPEVDEIILRALEKRPERRYQTAMEFARALDALEAGTRLRSSVSGLTPMPSPALSPPQGHPVHAPATGHGTHQSTGFGTLGSLTHLRGAVPEKLLTYTASLATMVGERRQLTVAYGEVATPKGPDVDAAAMRAATSTMLQELQDLGLKLGGVTMRLPGNALALAFGLGDEEDSGVGAAMRFALEGTQRVGEASARLPRPMTLRVGLHSGAAEDAVLAERAFESQGVEELLAVARRLASLAQPGRPLATRTVQKRTAERITWAERPSLAGDDLGPLYEASELRERKVTLEPMVGRAVELDYVNKLLDQLVESRPGGFLFVGGPGAGKSRLLEAAAQRALERRVTVARARGGRFGGASAFDVVRQLVHSLSAPSVADESADSTRTTLAGLQKLHVPQADIERLETLLGSQAQRASSGATAEENQNLDRAVLLELFRTVSKRHRLLILVDDAHLADAPSLELLTDVISRAGGLGVGIVAAARAGSSDVLGQLKRFELGALTRSEVQQLVAGRLPGGPPSAQLVDLVFERSDGNPLFAREIALTLVESGAARQVGTEWQLQGKLDELPDSLAALMSSRLDRLSAQARLLLRFGAIAGRTFPVPLVTAAVDAPLDVHAAISECVHRGILSPAPNQRDAYHFNQALMQDAMVARITPVDRKAVHLRLAEAIERGTTAGAENALEAMARHFQGADQPRKAVKYLKLAADDMRERRAWAAAVEAYRQCLTLFAQHAMGSGPVADATAQHLLDIVALAASAQLMIGPAEVVGMVDSALARVPDSKAPQGRAEVLRQRALALQRLTRLPEAEADLQKAVSLVPAASAPQLAASLRADLASVLEARGDLNTAAKLLVEGLSWLSNRKLEDKHLLWQYLNQLGRIHVRLGKLVEAGEFFDSARNQAKVVHSVLGESRVVSNLAVLAASRKDVGQAMTMFDEARQLAEEAGDRLGVLRARYNRARMQLTVRPEEAKVELKAVADEARALGWREGEALAVQAMTPAR